MNWKFVSTIFVLACSIGTSVYFYKHLEQALAENRIALEAFKSEVSISGKIIPKNAVAFFNLQKCPKGWMHFTQGEGRFPIATNYNRNNLSARRLNDVGGEESHKLTVKELPRHTHVYNDWFYYDAGKDSEYATGQGDDIGFRADQKRRTESAGDSVPHNNIPPYIALLQCTKR